MTHMSLEYLKIRAKDINKSLHDLVQQQADAAVAEKGEGYQANVNKEAFLALKERDGNVYLHVRPIGRDKLRVAARCSVDDGWIPVEEADQLWTVAITTAKAWNNILQPPPPQPQVRQPSPFIQAAVMSPGVRRIQ